MRAPLITPASVPPLEPYLSRRRDRPADAAAQLTCAAMLLEREIVYLALYDEYGPYGNEPPAEHQQAWEPFPATATGRQALAACRRGEEAPLDLFGLKREALDGLRAVAPQASRAADIRLLAARFCLDLQHPADALELPLADAYALIFAVPMVVTALSVPILDGSSARRTTLSSGRSVIFTSLSLSIGTMRTSLSLLRSGTTGSLAI